MDNMKIAVVSDSHGNKDNEDPGSGKGKNYFYRSPCRGAGVR
jgi:hypothetical protein